MYYSFAKLLKEVSFFVGYVKSYNFDDKLSNDEENKYIMMLKNENKEIKELAREKLITHNLRLVAHIVKKYDNCKTLNDDLISVGTIGLIKAIDSYDENKAKKLSSYLSRCIENEILMYIRSNKKVISTLSISQSIGQDDDGQEIKLEDILATEALDYNLKFDVDNKITLLKNYLNVLDDLEYKIISLRYGLNNKKEYTQKEIGKLLNISRSYVSRIEKRAINKLLYEFKRNEN
ncbi:MAG: RNA polymerase sporulation sigma factor SigK [Candidatus Caccosoma sp.]|nr:RNA polymerase sporulation sigma factor SigK [Candidatus Caccosoma sp.]